MTDILDAADDLIELQRDLSLAEIRKAAASIPNGTPGDCDLCGEWSGRLVDGACSPCRDRFGL